VETGLRSLVADELCRMLSDPDGAYHAGLREMSAAMASRVAAVTGKWEQDSQRSLRSFRARLAELSELTTALSARPAPGTGKPAVPPAFRRNRPVMS
jgi:hypothetical protein